MNPCCLPHSQHPYNRTKTAKLSVHRLRPTVMYADWMRVWMNVAEWIERLYLFIITLKDSAYWHASHLNTLKGYWVKPITSKIIPYSHNSKYNIQKVIGSRSKITNTTGQYTKRLLHEYTKRLLHDFTQM